VPAAAVVPAPRVYTKAVAVKTLVVEFQHPVISLVFSCVFLLVIFFVKRVNTLVGHQKRVNTFTSALFAVPTALI